ncbi:iap-2 [Palpita vitrealis nucleopolyhedrovirus]|uniref:Iap-2 n=1 Tax=Palpita vitrealis nucleopolyhedrovirus TaxID=2951960 RepID=A0AAE9RYS7_9ABAC|nr:iap-2 [Palpita vitrealis nucleopolyhedrovirus]
MNCMQFNYLILTTEGRLETMHHMNLDSDHKLELAKSGLFFFNNVIKCIGCYVVMKKIDMKHVKRHTYSDNCISSTNVLMLNEFMRKKSFASFRCSRRQFARQPVVVNMLAQRGFYSFGKPNHIRCSACHVVLKYKSVEIAQNEHKPKCKFINASYDCVKKIIKNELPPPRINVIPSAPPLPQSSSSSTETPTIQQISECKICFENEKSVCFLPCRHLAVCVQCARRCKKCCVCNAPIKQCIQTLPQ